MILLLSIFYICFFASCNAINSDSICVYNSIVNASSKEQEYVNISFIEQRFPVPEGFKRLSVDTSSFAHYLRCLELKAEGSPVYLYNGRLKPNQNAQVAVLTIDVGEKDLQQCADAIIRLRAEYLFKYEKYSQIVFNFTNGFTVPYIKWREGWRVKIDGNNTSWVKTAQPDYSYDSFRKYLELVFIYAGTLSLSKELKQVDISDILPGDVFIIGGSPGHAIIVIDVAISEFSNERIFLLAQSYMPAQDIHILKNPKKYNNPWYSNKIEEELITPEWTFKKTDLKRFVEE